MGLAFLLCTLAAVVPDTVPAHSKPDSSCRATVNLAPTLDNVSLLSGALAGPAGLSVTAETPAPDTLPGGRPRAIEYSDGYYTRLHIHRIASYLTIPLFAAQYAAGQALVGKDRRSAPSWARDLHGPLAGAVAGLFGVNTVTGVWNLWEGRKDPNGRTRRWVHGLSMIAADAGFVITGATAPHREEGTTSFRTSGSGTHQAVAIASMSVALSSYLMMLIWKD
jgi:hypothetical protein